ncbi:MAG: hypothetical protein IJN76_00475 [Clostridia bacterium]|nr:hypothetical protein [Clostridia bacterium]
MTAPPAPPSEPEPTPPAEYKSGGNGPDRVITRSSTPRKRSLMDRIEGWLSRK